MTYKLQHGTKKARLKHSNCGTHGVA